MKTTKAWGTLAQVLGSDLIGLAIVVMVGYLIIQATDATVLTWISDWYQGLRSP